VSDDGVCIFLIFVKEVVGTRESNLVDVLVDFFGGHTDTSVADSDGFLVDIHLYGQVAHFALEITLRSVSLQLLGSVNGIRHQFTKKNFVVAIQEFLDDGENIFGSYPNVSFLHDSYVFIVYTLINNRIIYNKKNARR